MYDATDVKQGGAATHIINSTHVIHKSTICVPVLEIIALLKQRGLVIPNGTSLTASFDADFNTLRISWSSENTDRQTATMVAFPLIPSPDPDLTAPEDPEPEPQPGSWTSAGATPLADILNVQCMDHGYGKRRHTCGKDGDPGAVAPLDGLCQACEEEKAMELEIPSCPKCGKPMTTSETARNAWTCLNQDCSSLRNWDKSEPVPNYAPQTEVPPALKRTEADTAHILACVAEVKAAVGRQLVQADLDTIAAGLPPGAK